LAAVPAAFLDVMVHFSEFTTRSSLPFAKLVRSGLFILLFSVDGPPTNQEAAPLAWPDQKCCGAVAMHHAMQPWP
jgi:hypothetical protein